MLINLKQPATGVQVTSVINATAAGLIDADTAHGITDYLPTNASLRLGQQNNTEGGGRIVGATDNTGQHALSFYGLCQDSAVATVNNFNFVAAEKSGTGIAAVASTKKVFAVKNNTTELLHITGDGRVVSQATAKCWISFNAQGTAAIKDSHNISSLSDQAVGWFYANVDVDLG